MIVPHPQPQLVEENPQVEEIDVEEIQEENLSSFDDDLHAESVLCCRRTLQRDLADAIVRLAEVDEISIILKLGAKINGSITQGLTPLHYAIWQRHPDAAEFLINEGRSLIKEKEIVFAIALNLI